MSIGNFTPVHVQEIPANTLFKVKPEIRFESLPMLSPLYDGFTMRTKFYAYPIRLALPELFKNRQQPWGAIPNFVLPRLTIGFDWPFGDYPNTQQFGLVSCAGSLLDMLGMCYGFLNNNQSFNNPVNSYINESGGNAAINMLPLIAYIECWMRGEYNPQDKLIPVLNEYFAAENTSLHRLGYYTYLHYDKLKKFVDYVRGYNPDFSNDLWKYFRFADSIGGSVNVTLNINSSTVENFIDEYPLFSYVGDYEGLYEQTFTPMSISALDSVMRNNWTKFRNITSNVGLLPTTYKGDYLSSWFNSEGISRLEEYAINNGESFLSLRQRNADFMIDLLSTISGDRGTDYLQFIFDTYLELKDHPILVGWDEIHFGANEDTTSTSNTGNGTTGVLGAVASKARDYSNKVKPISFKSQEPLLFLVCSTIVPNVVYSQGIDRFMLKTTYSDLWHPQYDARGFQRISPEEYYNPYACGLLNAQNQDSPWERSLLENYVSPFVPLGWEYMQHKNTLKGGMKTPRFETWSLLRDFTIVGVNREQRASEAAFEQLRHINPFDGSVFDGGTLVNGDEITALADWFTSLTSTYVRGVPYNIPFANVDAFDNQNFVVNYGFVVSQYQPITHNLITKTF